MNTEKPKLVEAAIGGPECSSCGTYNPSPTHMRQEEIVWEIENKLEELKVLL